MGGGVLALVLAAAVVAVIQGGTTHGLLPLQTFDAGDGAFAITVGEAAGGSLGYEDQALVLRCDDGNVGAGAALNREAWSIAFATDARVRAGTGSILLVVGEGGGAGAMFEVDVISSYAALWSQGSIVAQEPIEPVVVGSTHRFMLTVTTAGDLRGRVDGRTVVQASTDGSPGMDRVALGLTSGEPFEVSFDNAEAGVTPRDLSVSSPDESR